MKTVLVSSLVLFAVGCGYSSPGRPYPHPNNPNPATQAFQIDAGASIVQDQNTYGITTDGFTWTLAWIGDFANHEYTGSVYCPVGCTFGNVHFANALPGDIADRPANNQIRFNAVTNGRVQQQLFFTASAQPVTFELYIDRAQAIGATVFPSMGQLSTTDIMPFDLISSNATFKKGVTVDHETETVTPPAYKHREGAETYTVRAPEPKDGGNAETATDR